jgi:hypothetical protein
MLLCRINSPKENPLLPLCQVHHRKKSSSSSLSLPSSSTANSNESWCKYVDGDKDLAVDEDVLVARLRDPGRYRPRGSIPSFHTTSYDSRSLLRLNGCLRWGGIETQLSPDQLTSERELTGRSGNGRKLYNQLKQLSRVCGSHHAHM